MKVTVNVDCTPEEARTFLGLPDVQPMQKAMLAEMEKRMMAEMERFRTETGWLICPHTAVGTKTARGLKPSGAVATIVLATAAASKFPETVKEATGEDAPLPSRCAELLGRGEVFERFASDPAAVRARIAAFAG